MQIWYDRKGQPLDMATADRLLGDMAYARVARTRITSTTTQGVEWDVSTVWLGTNHNFTGDGAPIIFETMVFGSGDGDQYMRRYSTEEQANAGHAETVALVAATVPDEEITDLTD
ncbi:hypothetical protein [Streptomyces sp. NPDC051997]|uniref:hypothetical protein n=1 Tax=Streptomyces sp. NPDC051997 TaxID=3155611 RepID=UPI003432C443